jgi:hypothetical protein
MERFHHHLHTSNLRTAGRRKVPADRMEVTKVYPKSGDFTNKLFEREDASSLEQKMQQKRNRVAKTHRSRAKIFS